ncbi:DMT family transporter [Psychrobacter sp. I-STPA6b]|uniref:DMT family transporter n=1 Tax=Psychrobacter sp. I-STPA6b TaxID=2585718 RepID=UPI001D0CC7B8|nr:DMT family transporter [Psychrobacter sp. I-STPA6b]
MALTTRRASIGLIVGCIIFGLGSLIVAHVQVGGYAMSFWRLAVAGVVFTILAQLKKPTDAQMLSNTSSCKAQLCKTQSRKARGYALLSGALLGLDLALWHESIYAVGPGISTLLNSLQIFFLTAIGFVFFHERLSFLQWFSLLLAMFGVVMIASPEFAHNHQAAIGFITGISSGAMLALSMLFIRLTHEAQPTPILQLMQRVSIGGVLAMIIPMLWFDSGHILPNSMAEVGWIVIYGTVMQCLAWGLIAYSIPKLSLSITGLLLLSEPVAALLIDYVWLHKPINMMQWIGAGLTMLAIYLGSLKPKSAQSKQHTPKLRRYRIRAKVKE